MCAFPIGESKTKLFMGGRPPFSKNIRVLLLFVRSYVKVRGVSGKISTKVFFVLTIYFFVVVPEMMIHLS